jgi:hypothetical protein
MYKTAVERWEKQNRTTPFFFGSIGTNIRANKGMHASERSERNFRFKPTLSFFFQSFLFPPSDNSQQYI